MSTRYIVDKTGERVRVIIDEAEYERMIATHTKVVEAARVHQEAGRMMAGSGSSGTGYAGYRRALKTLEDAQRALFWGHEEAPLEDAEEAIRTHEAGTEKLERGKGDL